MYNKETEEIEINETDCREASLILYDFIRRLPLSEAEDTRLKAVLSDYINVLKFSVYKQALKDTINTDLLKDIFKYSEANEAVKKEFYEPYKRANDTL